MIFCCLSVGCFPAVYPTCTFTKHLAPLPYLTLYFYFCKWGREELNLQRLYHLGTDLQSAATPPIVAASPKCADTSLHISVRGRATHTVSNQLGTIGTEGFEPSIRLSLLFSVYTPLLPIKLRSETAIRRLAIMFIVPCVALGIQNADYSQTIDRLQANSII